MSLINDALKKARDKNPAMESAPRPVTGHAPLSASVRSTESSKKWIWISVACLALVAVTCVWWFSGGATSNSTPKPNRVAAVNPVPQTPPSALSQRPQQLVSPPPSVAQPPASVAPPPELPKPTPPPVAAPVASVVPQPPSPPVAALSLPRPELKVSMVIANGPMEERSAIVNGKRVYVGDVIEDATIVEIKYNMVRVRFNGEEYSLRYD